jgi:hypothetical protein
MNDTSNKFDQWWNQMEGFSLRAERFYDDVDSGDHAQLVRWLRAAYMQGVRDADAETAESLISLANLIAQPSQDIYNK